MTAPDQPARPSLAGVLLAAGASRRMGRPKQLLPLRGAPLLQHALDRAAELDLDEIVVVLGHHAEEIREALRLPAGPAVRVVVNPEPSRGQSSSLRVALRSLGAGVDAAVVLLGDQPEVGHAVLGRVVAAFTAGDRPMARPSYLDREGRRVPGHPVILARDIWPQVEALHGDRGARALIAEHPGWVLEVPIDEPPPADVDTWHDYEEMLQGAPESSGSGERTADPGHPDRRAAPPQEKEGR